MKHKHAEVLHAFADGIECEYKQCGDWFKIHKLQQFDIFDFVRIKPIPKADVVQYTAIGIHFSDNFSDRRHPTDNLKVTFDGETGNLKSAEVIR
jgi:hypothetical protein